MPHYIVPDKGDFDEVIAKCKTAGVTFLTPKTIREYILGTNEHTICVLAVSARDLLIFNRFAGTLLSESPSVVTGAPGPLYSSDWMTASASYFAMSWDEFSKNLSKSGLLSTTPEQLETRDRGVPTANFAPSALDELRTRMNAPDDVKADTLIDADDIHA